LFDILLVESRCVLEKATIILMLFPNLRSQAVYQSWGSVSPWQKTNMQNCALCWNVKTNPDKSWLKRNSSNVSHLRRSSVEISAWPNLTQRCIIQIATGLTFTRITPSLESCCEDGA